MGYLVTYCAGITKIFHPQKSDISEVSFLTYILFVSSLDELREVSIADECGREKEGMVVCHLAF